MGLAWDKFWDTQILFFSDLESLNKWNELVTSCRHAHKFLLSSFTLQLSRNSFWFKFCGMCSELFICQFYLRSAAHTVLTSSKMPSWILRWYHLDYNFFLVFLLELSDNRHLQWLEYFIIHNKCCIHTFCS